MGGVRFFGGRCAWVARWTGGGSDPVEIWRVVRLSKDLSACPRSGGRVLARSGHDLVGALACQHRECIVCRFWPEPLLELAEYLDEMVRFQGVLEGMIQLVEEIVGIGDVGILD